MSILFDEYKILQDKIDKIGAFRVTIKGWSVTAVIGALVAIASGKGFSPSVSSGAVDVLLIFFFWFEREQVRLSLQFGNRARRIELQFDRRKRIKNKSAFPTPWIAGSTFKPAKRQKLVGRSPRYPAISKGFRRIKAEYWLANKSDLVFYMALGFAAWFPKWLSISPPIEPRPVTIQNVIQVPSPTLPIRGLAPSSLPSKPTPETTDTHPKQTLEKAK